jgi:hypothetical protein
VIICTKYTGFCQNDFNICAYFQAQSGAPDDNEGTSYNGGVNYDDNHHLFDLTRRRASIARIVDTMQNFPEADGFIWDGPEWGYEIDVALQGNGQPWALKSLGRHPLCFISDSPYKIYRVVR